ncbi:P-loop containing nucleoside triphosphate hydrolase protein [Xylariales sp. AK1849]|nr:P-loop containing nucleoside triphosphate hydrolase protein [Xylariales sp. AK1849]
MQAKLQDAIGKNNNNDSIDEQQLAELSSVNDQNIVELGDTKKSLQEAWAAADQWEKDAKAAKQLAKKREDELKAAWAQVSQGSDSDKKKLQETERKLAEISRHAAQAEAARKQAQQEQERVQRDFEDKLQAKQAEHATVLQRQESLRRKLEDARVHLLKSQDNTRTVFDELQDIKGNLRVMCRIRPQLNAKDDELERLPTSDGPNSDHLQVISMAKRLAKNETDEFQMERVFGKNDTNEQIFKEVGQLVGSAINGRKVCIFAYGQTGSGKTHTMNYPWNEKVQLSGPVDSGIIPRSVEMISQHMSERKETWGFTVTGQYIEIYAEKVFDLLRDDSRDNAEVQVKWVRDKQNPKIQYFKADSKAINLTNEGDFEAKVQSMLTRAAGNRHTRATAGNAQSSRSHSVLTFTIGAERNGEHPKKTEGLLHLIDLAGSEKPSITDSTSQREGISINQSLGSLKKVLEEMADPKKTRISFRESVLTKLLQPSLGEGCKTLMFVMLSPLSRDREETRNTLAFAMKAQQVKLRTLDSGEKPSTPRKLK